MSKTNNYNPLLEQDRNKRRARYDAVIVQAQKLLFDTNQVHDLALSPTERSRFAWEISMIRRDIALLEARRDNPADINPIPTAYPFPGGMPLEQYQRLLAELTAFAEGVHNVNGLPNPYLGLASFEYKDREKFAGRQWLVEAAVKRLVLTSNPLPVLFITGASGSGKSSFAQAGLVPALEAQFRQQRYNVYYHVFRPANNPATALWAALRVLGLHRDDWQPLPQTPADFVQFLQRRTPPNQINLLVLDQFEELFTQSEASQRQILYNFLQALLQQPLPQRTYLIATFRSDYLPELFNQSELYNLAKYGIELRAMSEKELAEAIQRPLQLLFPNGKKRFEPELVKKLVEDAKADAAYLPLLQVTLEELWDKGNLRLVAYTNLTTAIQERANKVYEFRDFDGAYREPRPDGERAELMEILLALVNVSLDDNARRDVRRRRLRSELENNSPARKQLIESLSQARLLTTSRITQDKQEVEVVDIIHESLISNWQKLNTAIATRRSDLQQRVRFENALINWQKSGRSDKYLLQGVQLEEARELAQRDDIALRNSDARTLFDASVAFQEAAQKRELQRRQRQLRLAIGAIAALAVLLLLAVGTGIFAGSQTIEANNQKAIAQNQATAATDAKATAQSQATVANEAKATAQAESTRNLSLALAAESINQQDKQLDLSMLLAVEASRRDSNVQSRIALQQALDYSPSLKNFLNIKFTHVITFSPDGKTLASNSDDDTIILWEVASGKPINQLKGHTDNVWSVAFSPDGKTLASGSYDNIIILWDVATGKPTNQLKEHTRPVGSVAFSPDGKILASGSHDKTIILWDVATGKPTNQLKGHTDAVNSVVFSPDGKTLASGSVDYTTILWDVATGKPNQLKGLTNILSNVVFSPDGKTLALGSWDNTIILWDVATGKPTNQLKGHGSAVRSVAFNPDGKTLASGSFDNIIILWDVATGKPTNQLKGHTDFVYSLTFSPDGKTLASGSHDKTIILWDVASGKSTNQLKGHTRPVGSVAFSSDGKILASGSDDKTIILWDVASGKLTNQLKGHTAVASNVAFSPDGKTLASGSLDDTIILWDVASGKLTNQLKGHGSAVRSVAFNPDGKILASGSSDKTIILWDVASGKQANQFKGHTRPVWSVAFSPDGKTLASGSEDKTIILWDVASGKPTNQLKGLTDVVVSMAFSPDGKTLASSNSDKTIILWDVASGKPTNQLKGHSENVYSVAFSPDGKTLASGSLDDTIILWDVASGKPTNQLKGHSDFVYSVAYSPDGKTLASGSNDKTIILWHLSSVEEQQTIACSRANRNLSVLEWQQYMSSEPYHATCPGLPVPTDVTATTPAPAVTSTSGSALLRVGLANVTPVATPTARKTG